jgi:U6 snRNA-associated Sm-like protein LSm7
MNGGGGKKQQQQANKKHKPAARTEYPKKESILKLDAGSLLVVSFTGGRRVQGRLVGSDPLQNLVLDDVVELGGRSRDLGLVVLKGTAIESVLPGTGFVQIANPFTAAS